MPAFNKIFLRELYLGDSSNSRRFRLCLLVFDFVTVLFFIISSLFEPGYFIYTIDYLIALVISADFAARISLEKDRKKLLVRFDTWLDIMVSCRYSPPCLSTISASCASYAPCACYVLTMYYGI